MTDRLITILRAAHCRSTHQFFVLDALPLIKTDGGRRLGSQLLKHYKPYLAGAKAPDTEFRDFQNHVLHVRDGHWGGAASKAEKWYEQFVTSICRESWTEAAYNAGVLSHYFTDPLMPLHTAQSEIESVVHRPLEWSVTKSYDRIIQRYRQGEQKAFFRTSHGAGWLAEVVTKGAGLSNRHYDELIQRYDLEKGTRRPEEGFDDRSIDILSELFGVALTGWAHILERAAIDSNVDIPNAQLSVSSLIATISMPVAWIRRRIESAAEQNAVKEIFDEFRSTGTVTEHLPAEIKVVRRERQRDREAASHPIAPDTIPMTAHHERSTIAQVKAAPIKSTPSNAAPTIGRAKAVATTRSLPPFGLTLTDDLVDAPSIGPKIAKRFAGIGITTVEQFLAASPGTMAKELNTNWIDAETLVDWQDQARLVATVPGLSGYKAQLLVGAGCRDCQSLASKQAATLHRQIENFAGSSEGERILRNSKLPSMNDVSQWITNAAVSPQRRSA